MRKVYNLKLFLDKLEELFKDKSEIVRIPVSSDVHTYIDSEFKTKCSLYDGSYIMINGYDCEGKRYFK